MRKEKKGKATTLTRTTNTENSVNIIVHENTIVLLFPHTHGCTESSITVVSFYVEFLLLAHCSLQEKKNQNIILWIIWNIIVFFFYKWWEDLYNIIWPENRMLVIFWMEGQINFACSDWVFGESNDFNINRCWIS